MKEKVNPNFRRNSTKIKQDINTNGVFDPLFGITRDKTYKWLSDNCKNDFFLIYASEFPAYFVWGFENPNDALRFKLGFL